MEQNIINELKKYHTGKENAIHFRQLAFVFDLNERVLRGIVSEIIKSGKACICSTSTDGYYWPANEDEYLHAQNEDLSRIKELVKKHKGRRLAWVREKQQIKPKQLLLI